MIHREAHNKLEQLGNSFKGVAVIGPRQSGKTTLVKLVFPDKPYFSLENPDIRRFALEDPRGFLKNMPHGGILDEVQRTPELFSYLQEILDNSIDEFYRGHVTEIHVDLSPDGRIVSVQDNGIGFHLAKTNSFMNHCIVNGDT